MGDKALLSVAMIVRNEAQHLRAAVASVQPLAGEVVVVDTGSEDDTLNIAREMGCVVHAMAWPGDFATARNAALERCQGQWIFVLDGDECLGTEDHEAFRALLQGEAVGWRFTTRNYTNARDQRGFAYSLPEDRHSHGFLGWSPSTKVRLFPNVPGARFEGEVHELINPALERLAIPLATTTIPIHHYAEEKDEAAQQAKAALYRSLGEAKVARDPENAHALAELGHQYLALGEVAAALRVYKEAVTHAPASGEMLVHLGSALFHAGRATQAMDAYTLAVAREPGNWEAWHNLGVTALTVGDFGRGLDALERAAEIEPGNSEVHRCRSLALHGLGRDEEACQAAGDALAANPGNREAGQLFVSLMKNPTCAALGRARLAELEGQHGLLPSLAALRDEVPEA